METRPHDKTRQRDPASFPGDSAEDPTLPPGTLLEGGRFQIGRELGRGGFGAVYLAQDLRLKRACVVKHLLIPPDASQSDIADLRRTFEREADALVGLNQPGHPNIPEIYDFFSDAAGHYLVMKYIEGETLQELLEHLGGSLPWREAVEFAVQVADALAYMHGRQPPVLHRDIKPANILRDATGRVWLVDFGLSKAQPSAGGKAGKTTIAGSVGYTPLEQWAQQAVPASDVYALGASLHHLLTGIDPTLPFDVAVDEPHLRRIIQQQHGQFAPVRGIIASLPVGLEAAVASAVRPMPEQRPGSHQWKAELEALIRPAAAVQPLTFPGNETATDLPTLADRCADHWDYGRRILYDGSMENWLRNTLHDPVAADKAQAIVRSQKDPDLGLDQFIRQLNPAFPPPRLQVLVPKTGLDAGILPWRQVRRLTLEVTNAGHGALLARGTSAVPWLTVSPASVSCVAGRTATMTLSVDSGKLVPGRRYQEQLTLDAGDAGRWRAPVSVGVPPPQLDIRPQVLDLGSAYQGQTLSSTFTIRNTGASACSVRLSCAKAAIHVEPGSCSLEPGRSVTVTVRADTGGLPPGRHTVDVNVAAEAGGWNQATTVPARMRLPRVKTLWNRWAARLDWAGVGVLLALAFFVTGRLLLAAQDALELDWPAQIPAGGVLTAALISAYVCGFIFNTGSVLRAPWRAAKRMTERSGGAKKWDEAGCLAIIVWPLFGLPVMIFAALLAPFWYALFGENRRPLILLVSVVASALAAMADPWLGVAPTLLVATLAGAILAGSSRSAARSEYRRRSGAVAILGLIVAVSATGYVLTQPRYWWHRVRTFGGDQGTVVSLAFSPDGGTLATAGGRDIRLWRVSDGSPLQTLRADTHEVYSVAFSPDGTTLASGSQDNTVGLWRVSDGSLLRSLEGHTGRVFSVAFSPDGTTLASGSQDGTVRLWRVSDGSLLSSLEGNPGSLGNLTFSPDGSSLAGTDGKRIRMWRVPDGMLLQDSTTSDYGFISHLAFRPGGELLAFELSGRSISLWEISDGEPPVLIATEPTRVFSPLALSPDGQLLADGELRLRQATGFRVVRSLAGSSSYYLRSIAFSPDGSLIAAGSYDGAVRLWYVGEKTPLQALKP